MINNNGIMAAQPLPLSVEEFHRLYDGAKPAYEYWFGKAVQKTMPTTLHGVVQFLIATLLERARWNTSTEVCLKIVPNVEPVPDVIAVRGKLERPYPTAAPELCVEILSPGDPLVKVLEKARRYLSWGSECVWIIDPENRTAWTCSREPVEEPQWVQPGGSLRIGDTAIELDLLFSEADRKLGTTVTE